MPSDNHTGNTVNYWRVWMDLWWEDYEDRHEYHAKGGTQAQNWGFAITSGITTTICIDGSQLSGSGGMSSSYGGYEYTQQTGQLNKTEYKSYGSSRSFSIWAKAVNNSGYMGGTSSVSWTGSVPARAYSAPSAPTNCKVARNSATSMKVTWTNNATATNQARPYTGVTVQRAVDGGSWGNLASLGVVTSYTDASTSDGHWYKYRVVAKNSAGSSAASNEAAVYSVPSAPGTPTASRSSDSSIAVAWKNNATTARPWSSVLVFRSVDGASAVQAATLGGSASSWTDSGAQAGHSYRYWVCAKNAYGQADTGWSPYVYTTPKAMSKLAASKPTATTVRLSGEGKPAYADSYEFQRSTDGGKTWAACALDSSWTDSAPPAGTVTYRARAVKAQGGSSNAQAKLYSAWTSSNSVQTIVAPLAPSVALSGSVFEEGAEVSVSWARNHPDGTEQAKAQVELTAPDGTVSTADVAGSASSWAFTPSANGSWKLRVRTYGLYAAWGAWSAYSAFTVAALPQAAFTSPAADGDAVTRLPFEVAWEVADSTGVAAQLLVLSDSAGNPVASLTPDPDARSWEMTPALGLRNGEQYRLSLGVTGGSSLSTSAVRGFETLWTPPNAAVVDVERMDGMSVRLFAREDAHSDDLEPVESLDVVRVMPDGSRAALMSGAAFGREAVDPIPPLNVPYAYEVTSRAAAGATTVREVAAYVDSKGAAALNFGSRADSELSAELSPSLSGSREQQGEAFHFADGGERGGLPSFYALDEADAAHQAGFTVVGADAVSAFLAGAAKECECWWRDPYGGVAFCRASWSWQAQPGAVPALAASAKLTELAWEEPFYG